MATFRDLRSTYGGSKFRGLGVVNCTTAIAALLSTDLEVEFHEEGMTRDGLIPVTLTTPVGSAGCGSAITEMLRLGVLEVVQQTAD